MKTMLIIENDESTLDVLTEYFSDRYSVITFKTLEQSEKFIKQYHGKIDIVLVDLFLETGACTDLLDKLHKYFPVSTVIVMSAFNEAGGILLSCKYDYLLSKPFSLDHLENVIRNYFK